MKQKLMVRSLAAAGLVTVLGLGGLAQYGPSSAHAVTTTQAVVPTAAPSAALPAFAQLVERNGAAVVNISVTANMKTGGVPDMGISPDDPMYEFFKRFGGGQGRMQPQQ